MTLSDKLSYSREAYKYYINKLPTVVALLLSFEVDFLMKMLYIAFTLLISASYVTPSEPNQTITTCPKQCACNAEYVADLPLMKWLTLPIDKYWQQDESPFDNQVWDENDEVRLQHNPLLHAAFCVVQEDTKFVSADEFSPAIEALTILYGPDSLNRTIEDELSTFHDLLALDIQGYQQAAPYLEIFLKHNGLLALQNLQFLNIQYVNLLPNPNSTNKDIPKAAQEYLQTIRLKQAFSKSENLTFILPDEPEIVPYEEFKTKTNIVSTFAHLSNLQILRLYRCKLEFIRWEMFDGLQNLQTLSLEGNEISRIPEFAFYGMPNLKVLILSNNKLSSISTESLAGLFYLEHLDLTYNQLRYLSDFTFAPLPKLISLDIQHNPTVSIRGGTFEVMNMTRELFIGNDNNAVAIHSLAFNGLIKLEKLLIVGLNVSTLEKSLLQGMPFLKHLKLQGKVEYIYFDAFANSIQLVSLILKDCSLRSLSMDAFYGLVNLESLDLSDNNLATLPKGIFDGLESLVELILANNKLTSLPPNVFDNLGNIQTIRLDNNPWDCTCELSTLPFHIVNKVKKARLVEKCNYRYDKSPCSVQREDYYAYSPKTVPKCDTPEQYSGMNLPFVMKNQNKLNCRKQAKNLKNENNFISLSPSQTGALHTSNSEENAVQGGTEPKFVDHKLHFSKQKQTKYNGETENSSIQTQLSDMNEIDDDEKHEDVTDL